MVIWFIGLRVVVTWFCLGFGFICFVIACVFVFIAWWALCCNCLPLVTVCCVCVVTFVFF